MTGPRVGNTVFGGVLRTQNQSGMQAEVVVPGTDFVNGMCNKIYVGGAGNITVMLPSGPITFTGVPAGFYLDVGALQVTAATATNMVALF